MGGKSGGGSQVTGYKYFAKILRAIGCPIENFIGINVDNRGWHYGTRTPLEVAISDTETVTYGVNISVNAPNLFGKEEGGISGNIQVFFGTNEQPPHPSYAAHMVANGRHPVAYQGSLSYMVFGGGEVNKTVNVGGIVGDILNGKVITSRQSSFYFGNTGYLHQILLWPTRVFTRPDLKEQWYVEKAGIKAGTINQINQSINRLALILDNSGSMSGSKMNALKSALQNLRANVANDKVKFSELRITAFGHTNVMLYASNKAEALDVLASALVVLDASGTDTDATQAFFDFNGFFKKPTPRDLAIVVSDGSMTNVAEAKASVSSTAVRIAGIGVGTIGSLAEFHNMPNQIPVVSGNANEITNAINNAIKLITFDYYDQNPIHAIREIFTEDLAMGLPEADMNDEMFMRAADQIYNEGLGISCAFQNKNCKEAIDEICYHIEGGVRQNRQTGLIEPVLFRDDWYDLDTVMHFTPKEIRNFQVEPTNIDEAINTLNVEYYDRDLIQSVSFPVYNNGSILNAERQNAEDVKFPYFMNARNAEMVAKWKLKQLTIPTWMGSFKTSHYNARSLNRYDVIKVTFPKRNIFNLPVRIMKINLGDGSNSNEVTLEWVEVVPYSTDMASSIVIEEPIKTDHSPKPCEFKLYEMSYLDLVRSVGQREADAQINYSPDVGFLMVAAIRPQDISPKAVLYVEKSDEYVESTNVSYCPSIVLNEDINQTDTMFSVKDGTDLTSLGMQTIALLGTERILLVDYDEETELLTVKRGIEHTIPTPHFKNDTIYIVHDFTNVDAEEYIDGEEVSAKVLTLTPSSMLSLDDAQEETYEIDAIANRPYPPANVKINGTFMPVYFEDDFVLTWSNRNRTQQTGGEILGYFEPSVSLEENAQTLLTVIELDVNDVVLATHSANVTALNSYTLLESSMQAGTRSLHINIKTVRDGYECLYAFDHIVMRSTLVAPSNVTFEVIEY